MIDMATSAVAYGKIEIAAADGTAAGRWLGRRPDRLGHTGSAWNDRRRRLLPLGGDRKRGGHKGYALSAMVDILCGVLSGANWGPFVPPFALSDEIPQPERGQGDRPLLRGDADRRVHGK